MIALACRYYYFTERFMLQPVASHHMFIYCIHIFLLGGILFLFSEKIKEMSHNKIFYFVIILCPAILTVGYYVTPFKIKNVYLGEIKLLVLFSSYIIFAICDKSKLLSIKVAKFISDRSLELYLSHMFCYRILEKIGVVKMLGNSLISYILIFFLVVFVALVYIEVFRILTSLMKRNGVKNA